MKNVCRKKTATLRQPLRQRTSQWIIRGFRFARNLLFEESQPAPPLKVNIEVNGFVYLMEVDTGASTSQLNWDTCQQDQY